MTTTGLDAFDKTIHKTNTLLKQIETELGWENQRNMSYAVFRAVLHALRDRLTVQEAADLAAQLPLLVQGIFYDGWNPSSVPKKIHKDEFLEEIRKNFTFSIDRSINEVVIVVLSVLRKHVSEGELEDVLSVLPKDLSSMLKQLE
ncbi:MAG TPA: DUF2267 domain-containing protein [Nitrososphaeraceae archaeon]|jgi:uncharacterized protein (DUF2267 family)|nr:DUF2267 domain-containing protein [Nitrososphaeraceae archaeon]